MKHSLLLLCFLLLSLQNFAQTIITQEEIEKQNATLHVLTQKELEKDSKIALAVFSFSNANKENEHQKFINDRVIHHQFDLKVNKFVEEHFKEFGNFPSKLKIYAHLYINEFAKVNYCIIYESFSKSLDSTQTINLKNFFQKMIQEVSFDANLGRKFIYSCQIPTIGRQEKHFSHEVLSTLENAEKTTMPDTIYSVNFSGLELTEVPTVLKRFPNLRELKLSDNYIQEIPSWLSKFKLITNLDLSKNDLQDNRVFFKRNKHIKVLNLQYNSITKVPRKIRKNKALEILFLGNNPIETLDNQSLRKLEKVEVLNLYNLGLKTLPKTISKMQNLKELDLYYNN